MNHFVVLGIHGEDVETVQGNFARVRMYVGDKEFDEDFALPTLPVGVPKTSEVYTAFLKSDIEKRISELEVKNV